MERSRFFESNAIPMKPPVRNWILKFEIGDFRSFGDHSVRSRLLLKQSPIQVLNTFGKYSPSMNKSFGLRAVELRKLTFGDILSGKESHRHFSIARTHWHCWTPVHFLYPLLCSCSDFVMILYPNCYDFVSQVLWFVYPKCYLLSYF